MNKKWQFPVRRMLALLLCVASLLGMFPTVLRQEANAAEEGYRDHATAVAGAVTADGKQIAYMGQTVYNVTGGTTISDILTTVSRNITVFDADVQGSNIPYDKDSDYVTGNVKVGYYSIYLPESFDANTSGSYEASIIYNGTNRNIVVGTVTLNVSASGSTGILGMGGLRDHATAFANPSSTNVARFSLKPLRSNTALKQGTLLAIKSAKYDTFMSYDPYRENWPAGAGNAVSQTGSFTENSDGNSLGTIYAEGQAIVSSSNSGYRGTTYYEPIYYMDHSLRNDALWMVYQRFSANETVVSTTNTANFWLVGHGQKAENFTSVGDKLTPLVTNDSYSYMWPAIALEKGGTSYDSFNFWNHYGDTATDMLRFLKIIAAGGPFSNWERYHNSSAQAYKGGDTDPESLGESVIEALSDGRYIIYYRAAYNNNSADLRVLTCDENGTWRVKRYQKNSGTPGPDTYYYSSSTAALNAMKNNEENYVYLYTYETENDTKRVAYKGYTTYNVTRGIDKASLLETIYDNLIVFDIDRKNQYVPGENDSTTYGNNNKPGYYYLDLSGLNTSVAGSYPVKLMYNEGRSDSGTMTTKEIGTITVNVQEVSYTVSTKEGVVSLNAGADRAVYPASGSANATSKTGVYITVSVGGQTTQVPVTLGMLSKNGAKVDTSTTGKQTGLTLTYMGETLANGDFALWVYGGTLTVDKPAYPKPGSVAVDKVATTTQDAFYNNGNGNGVANIQLSTKGKNSVLGVDLVIVMDLSSSMKYSLDSNTYAADTADDPSRLTVLKESLTAMITKMQNENMDVRIALADFGDLDHYEFTEAVVYSSTRNWPQIETYIQGPEAYSDDDSTKCYKVNYNYDPPNHLNFVLGHDRDYNDYNSQTFALHYSKYDNQSGCNFTGKLLPYIYTGDHAIGAGAFVDVNKLSNVDITSILGQIEIQNDKALGTNYDVGLEYAYRLAYHRQQQNKADKVNRMVSVIFMSDGAAMQYNYFSGRSQLESWNQYLQGNTGSLITLGDNNPIGGMNLRDTSTLNEEVKMIMVQMHQQLAFGNLRQNGNIYPRCKHKNDYTKAYVEEFVDCYETNSGQTMSWNRLLNILIEDAESGPDDPVNVNGYAGKEAVKELIRLVRMDQTSYEYSTYSPYWYFYNQQGKNWWAEAMKGSTDQIYPVVNRHYGKTSAETNWLGELYQGVSITSSNKQNVPDYMMKNSNQAKNYISGFPGLGIDIYTIGFAITVADNRITVDTAKKVLKSIATTPNLYYDANSASALVTALNDIVGKAVTSASNAYATDTMGEQYDLLTGANMANKGVTPEITLKEYTVVYNATTGKYERSSTPVKTWETITFGSNGVAYSDKKTGDIWDADGGIRGEYIYYNANTDKSLLMENIRGTGRSFTLQPETFFWSIGTIGETELVLEYQVYLVGSTEGTLPNVEKTYDTNKEAIFHYKDELGNWNDVGTTSPSFTWKETAPAIQYQFYLVNASGAPLDSNMNSTGVTVANSHKVGDTSKTVAITMGTGDTTTTTLTASDLLSVAGVSTDLYELYQSDTKVEVVSQKNVQSHTATITDGNTTKKTTYVGTSTDPLTGDNATFAATTVYFAVKLKNRTSPDTVVVDYGLSVNVDMLSNDKKNIPNAVLYGYSHMATAPDASVSAPTGFTKTPNKLKMTYGTLEGTVWTPGNMKMDGYERFVYCANDPDSKLYYYSTVTIIPATSIYYEDSFVILNHGPVNRIPQSENEVVYNPVTLTWATWESVGSAISSTQNQDRPGDNDNNIDAEKIYGFDDAYKTTATYSGAAKKVTVTPTQPARAHFTFTGTGFDIISLTDNLNGGVTVYVYEGATTNFDIPGSQILEFKADGTFEIHEGMIEGDTPIRNIMVNTYYSEGTMYQIPIIKCNDLDYGTYTVEILVAYDEWFAEDTHEGEQFDFYLDAIRIYNPAGIDDANASDKTIVNAHTADGEGWPRYQELRDMVLKAANVELEQADNGFWKPKTHKYNNGTCEDCGAAEPENDSINGILFIDGSSTADGSFKYSDYASWGPNNELYLRNQVKNSDGTTTPAQSVAFTLNVLKYKQAAFSTGTIGDVSKVHIGLKGLGGTSQVQVYQGTTLKHTFDLSANEQYFDITDLKNQSIRITVSGSKPVAITNIKVTHTAIPDDYKEELGQTKSAAAVAMTSQTLKLNADSMAALFTVNGDMAADILNELNQAQNAPTDLVAKYASLSFKDLIHTNIYFTADKYAGIEADKLGLAVFDRNDENGTVDTAAYVVNGATLVDGMYKVSTQGIPAKNLGDTIYFKVFAIEADGSYTYSKLLAYSPLEYANFLIESGSDMDKTLAAAMLNYGAEAQKYFGYNTEALMNANVTEEAKALLSGYSINDLDALDAIDETKVGTFAATEGFAQKYPSVSFKGAFQINYYFQPTAQFDGNMTFYYWTEDTYNAVTQLTADNADGTAVMTADNGIYSAVSGPIFAKDLDKTVYVAAVYEANGEVCCTGVLAYSVAEYARTFADTTDAFAPFAQAIGTYGSVAKAYFGN